MLNKEDLKVGTKVRLKNGIFEYVDEDSEPDSDLCMESKKVDVSKIISNNIKNFEQIQKKQHNTHYLKFTLNKPNLSVRFHLSFEDNKELQNKWILKNHDKKEHEVLTPKVARMLIENFCEVECQEIIGRLEFGKYQKITVNSSGVLKEFE